MWIAIHDNGQYYGPFTDAEKQAWHDKQNNTPSRRYTVRQGRIPGQLPFVWRRLAIPKPTVPAAVRRLPRKELLEEIALLWRMVCTPHNEIPNHRWEAAEKYRKARYRRGECDDPYIDGTGLRTVPERLTNE